MEFKIKAGIPETQHTACVVAGVYLSNRLSKAATQLDKASGGIISDILNRGDMEGKAGDALTLCELPNISCKRVVLVGCGRKQELNDNIYRKINHSAAQYLQKNGASEAVSYLIELPIKDRNLSWKLRQAVMSTTAALYSFQLRSRYFKGNSMR